MKCQSRISQCQGPEQASLLLLALASSSRSDVIHYTTGIDVAHTLSVCSCHAAVPFLGFRLSLSISTVIKLLFLILDDFFNF